MDGNSSPHTKLLHRHTDSIADGGENKEADGIEDKHYAKRNRHRLCFGFDHRPYGCDGAATAYGRTCRNEVTRLIIHLKHLTANQPTNQQCAKHRNDGECHSFGARLHGLIYVHAKTQTNHRILEQLLGHGLVEIRIGFAKNEGKHQTNNQCNRRGNPMAYPRPRTQIKQANFLGKTNQQTNTENAYNCYVKCVYDFLIHIVILFCYKCT